MGCVTQTCWLRIRCALAAVDCLPAQQQCKHSSTHEYNAGSERDTADRYTMETASHSGTAICLKERTTENWTSVTVMPGMTSTLLDLRA